MLNHKILATGLRGIRTFAPRHYALPSTQLLTFSSSTTSEERTDASAQKTQEKRRSFIQKLQSDFGRAATSGPEAERPRVVAKQAKEETGKKKSLKSDVFGDDEIEIPIKFATRARQRRATAGNLSRQAAGLSDFESITKGVKDLELINQVNVRAFSEDIGEKTEFLSNAGSGTILAKATMNIDRDTLVPPPSPFSSRKKDAVHPESVQTMNRQQRLRSQLEASELGNRMAGSEVIGPETEKIPVDATGPVLQGQYQTGSTRDAERARNIPWKDKYRGSGRAT